jgi:hypothetical protein
MGAGISRTAKNARIRRSLQRVARELGGSYAKYEATGAGWRAFMACIGPASNGESFGYLVLKIGDDTYADFGTATGRYEDGVARLSAASQPYDTTGNIIAYESGELDDEEIVTLFQHLIDTGLAWKLQGSYGRTAQNLINGGYCNG